MNIQLLFATIAIIAFLGIAFYTINSIDDKPARKHS